MRRLAPRRADAAPEGRYEGRRLQEGQKLRLPGSRMAEYMVERVGGCLGMHRDHRRPRQHQLRGGGEERLPYRAGGHAAFQEIDRRPACVELRNLAERADEPVARRVVPTALFPGLRNLSQHRLERPPGPVGRQVAGGGIRAVAVILECGCQRAKQGSGVFGPDKRQEAVRVLHRDGLVADRAKIPDAVSKKDLEELLRRGQPGEIEDSGIDGLGVPAVQRIDQAFAGRLRRTGRGGRPRTHRPAAPAALRLLGALEIVERPEYRQPAFPARQVERRQVDGLQRKHRVVFEPDMGERPDPARSRDGQGGERPAVVETAPDQARKLGGDAFAGRFFQEAVQGAGPGKRPGQGQSAAQAECGCTTGGAQEFSTVHAAIYMPRSPTGNRLPTRRIAG